MCVCERIGLDLSSCNGLCGLMFPDWDDDTPQVGCKSGVLEYWSIGVLGPKAEKDLICIFRPLIPRDPNMLHICP